MPTVLDQEICARARLARDPRFDGKFYICVHTTKIYCRPVCRSRTSREENVCYLPSAAAAAAAGYRPCLRCRPEASPGSPAWAGTRNTVARALRLLNETGLEEGGVEALAAHLGIGSRHLRRLFLRHLGATPRAVAQTRRLQFAKKLIDETLLPMTQIAIASGFGTVRRFNAAIRESYDRTPSQIRVLARQPVVRAASRYEFRLAFRPPYRWSYALDFLAARAIPGLEAIENGRYRRSIFLSGQAGSIDIGPAEAGDALLAKIEIGDPGLLFVIIHRLRSMFDLDADWMTIGRSLQSDVLLAARISADPGRRIIGCFDAFEFIVRAILKRRNCRLKQRALTEKLVLEYGRTCPVAGIGRIFPSAASLCTAELEALGISRIGAEAIRALSRAVHAGRLSFERINDSAAVIAALGACPGIGAQTVQHVAVHVLHDTDALPLSAPTLKRLLGRCCTRDVQARQQAWRPWRAYAALYLDECEPDPAVAEAAGKARAAAESKAPSRQIAGPQSSNAAPEVA